MIQIMKGVPMPSIGHKQAGSKYPLADMEVGDSFFVLKSEMIEGDDPSKFRNRINQSVRNYAIRVNKGVEEDTKKQFSVVLMTETNINAYEIGDVGVWRTA